MVTGPSGDPVTEALRALAAQDLEVARLAEAAFDSLTFGEGLAGVTQHGLQEWLWYQLPLKWLTDPEEHLALARALGRLLELLDRPRYAAICLSEQTERILAAYAHSESAGRAAFRRAVDASGVEPPALADFAWSPVMGTAEVTAYLRAADRLEHAVASEQLRPGSRGWRAAQQRLVAAHLDTVDPLSGQTPRLLVLTERVGRWADRGGPTGRRLRATVANRLLPPVPVPASAGEGLASLRWLLQELEGGVRLTQVGNLPRRLVLEAVDRFGWWHFPGRPRGEHDVVELWTLRELTERLGAVRRRGRRLELTRAGQGLRDDSDALWRAVARSLVTGGGFDAAVAELALLTALAGTDAGNEDQLEPFQTALAEDGWQERASGDPPSASAVRSALATLIRPARLFGLLDPADAWTLLPRRLTKLGRATALEALRSVAAGPRAAP